MAMTVIECEHTFLSDQNLDSLSSRLQAKSANWRQPLIRSESLRSRRTQIGYVLLVDPAVEFDDAKTSATEIEAILWRFGLKLRTL